MAWLTKRPAQSYAGTMLWILASLLSCGAPPENAVDDTGTLPVDSGDSGRAIDSPIATVDVLIIGSGPAGLSAAWEARAAGASVLVLERDEFPGGAGFMASNLFAVGTRHQEVMGIEDSTEIAAAEWPLFTQGGDASDPWVQRLLEESSTIIDWLVDEIGSELLGVQHDPSAGFTPRIHTVSLDLNHPLHEVADSLEKEIWLFHEATALVLESGRVVGSQFEDLRNGEEGWIQADQTIIATGGFARNDDALFEDRPEIQELLVLYETHHQSNGGGIALLDEANASTQNSGSFGLYAHSIQDWRIGMEREALWLPSIRQSLIVDLNGKRVASELEAHGFALQDALLKAPEQRLFALFPSAVWVPQKIVIPHYNLSTDDTNSLIDSKEAVDAGAAFDHFSLAELAEFWGMDLSQLETTISTYETASASGQDLEFGKAPQDLVPFGSDTIFSVELHLGAAKAFGGAELDSQARVINQNGDAIEGLWAAGEAAGMLGTPAVGSGFSGSVTGCYLTGKVAGQNAAAQALAD